MWASRTNFLALLAEAVFAVETFVVAEDSEVIAVLAAVVLDADTVVGMGVGMLETVAVEAEAATVLQHYYHARESYQITALDPTLD